MTTTATLNPNAVVPGYPVGSYTLVGAASIEAALSDSSDSSYVQSDDSTGLQIALLFPAPSLPSSGSLVQSMQLRIRRSSNTAGLAQLDPFWWWQLNANDVGFLGTGINVQNHTRTMGPELTPDLDGTTAIQTHTSSVISWFDDGEHVRNMSFGSATIGPPRFIILHWPGNVGGAQYRLYKVELLVNYNTMPVATVTAPPDPVNSSKPTVSWTYTDADNDNQTRARVVIVKPGTPSDYWPYGLPGQFGYQADGARVKAWDSGDLYTAGTSTSVTVGLTNGQQYYAYVRVWAQPVASTEQRSFWYYKVFTVTATGPATPTFTVTPDGTNSRILLNIQESSSSSPHPAYYEVERLDPGQTFYTPVRNGTQVGTYVGSRITGTGVGWAMPNRTDAVYTNGLQVTWYGKLTDYTPGSACTLVSKGTATGNQRAWIFRVRTDGKLELQWSTAGTSYNITATSSTASSVTDNTDTWFRATLVSNTNPWSVVFEKSTNGTSWTAIGTTVTGAGPQTIFTSTANLYVGGIDGFTSEAPVGTTYEVLVADQSGIVKSHPKLKGQPQLTTSFLDETGNVWTYTSGANGYNQVELQVYDYEAPLGVPVTYEARAWRHDTDVTPSAWVGASGSPWTLSNGKWQLKDPLDPTNNTQPSIVSLTVNERKPQTAFIPIGDSMGVVTHTGMRGSLLDAEFRTLDGTQYAMLRDLICSGRTILLQDPFGRQWYLQSGDVHPYEVIKAAPTVGETSPIRNAQSIKVQLIEVEAP